MRGITWAALALLILMAQAQASDDPKPKRWCGWFLRHELGIADRSFNLAWRWASWGRPSPGPCVRCVAVSRHHVGLIVGGGPGHWIVRQGNPLRHGVDALRWARVYRAP
jgi:hypothetical protein